MDDHLCRFVNPDVGPLPRPLRNSVDSSWKGLWMNDFRCRLKQVRDDFPRGREHEEIGHIRPTFLENARLDGDGNRSRRMILGNVHLSKT